MTSAPTTAQQFKPHAVEIADKGDTLEISVGTVVKSVKKKDIAETYMFREFARGLKLRIDNAAAGVDGDDKKTSAKLKMLEQIDFGHPTGGISGGRKKEGSESFLARTNITSLEDYQAAVADAQANVRKDELSDALVELSTLLADVM